MRHDMTGGTFNHAAISGNLLAIIRNATKGGHCSPMNSDMRIDTPRSSCFRD